MIPPAFEYARAGSVADAIELLARDDARALAGGHSLIPLLRLRFARPSLLVDIGRLEDLRHVRDDGDRIAIGAGTRHCDLARDPRAAEQALAARASPAEAAGRAAEGTDPPSDVSASAEYRAHLAQVLTRQALERL